MYVRTGEAGGSCKLLLFIGQKLIIRYLFGMFLYFVSLKFVQKATL